MNFPLSLAKVHKASFIKRRKIGNAKLNFLNEELANEKEKLNELNKDKTNDLMFVETKEKIVDRSVQIDILKKVFINV